MAYDLARFVRSGGNAIVSEDELRRQIERLMRMEGPRYRRMWAYYRNPSRATGVGTGEGGAERPYRQAQEWGLPSRITGVRSGREPFLGEAIAGVTRKEVVIENDIGWRIDAMVDCRFELEDLLAGALRLIEAPIAQVSGGDLQGLFDADLPRKLGRWSGLVLAIPAGPSSIPVIDHEVGQKLIAHAFQPPAHLIDQIRQHHIVELDAHGGVGPVVAAEKLGSGQKQPAHAQADPGALLVGDVFLAAPPGSLPDHGLVALVAAEVVQVPGHIDRVLIADELSQRFRPAALEVRVIVHQEHIGRVHSPEQAAEHRVLVQVAGRLDGAADEIAVQAIAHELEGFSSTGVAAHVHIAVLQEIGRIDQAPQRAARIAGIIAIAHQKHRKAFRSGPRFIHSRTPWPSDRSVYIDSGRQNSTAILWMAMTASDTKASLQELQSSPGEWGFGPRRRAQFLRVYRIFTLNQISLITFYC